MKTQIKKNVKNAIMHPPHSSATPLKPKKITLIKQIIYFVLYYWYTILRYFYCPPPKKKSFVEIEAEYIESCKKLLIKAANAENKNVKIEDIMYKKKQRNSLEVLRTSQSEDSKPDKNTISVCNEETSRVSTKLESIYDKRWRSRILIESTPTRGNIIMYYSPLKRAFSYYANQRGIPYDILNAVSMRYVWAFKCFDFFIDERILEEIKCAKSPLDFEDETPPSHDNVHENRSESESMPKIPSSNTAFAQLKKYDNRGEIIVPEKDLTTNSFCYIDKADNYNILKIPESKSKNILFRDFDSKYSDLFDRNAKNATVDRDVSWINYKNQVKAQPQPT